MFWISQDQNLIGRPIAEPPFDLALDPWRGNGSEACLIAKHAYGTQSVPRFRFEGKAGKMPDRQITENLSSYEFG
jgi:hypothetical protein